MSRSPRNSPRDRHGALDDGSGPEISGGGWTPVDPYPPPRRSPVTHSAPRRAKGPGPDEPVTTHSKSRRRDWDDNCTWVRWSLDPDLSDLAPLKVASPTRSKSPPRRRVRKRKGRKTGKANPPPTLGGGNGGGSGHNGGHGGEGSGKPFTNPADARGPGSHGGQQGVASSGQQRGGAVAAAASSSTFATQTPRNASVQTSLPNSSEDEDAARDYYSGSESGDSLGGGGGGGGDDGGAGGEPQAPEAAAFIEGLLRHERQGAAEREMGGRRGDGMGNGGNNGGVGGSNGGEAGPTSPVRAFRPPPKNQEELYEASLRLRKCDEACDAAVNSPEGRRVVVFFTCSPDCEDAVETVERQVWPEVNRYCRQRGDLDFAVDVVPVFVPDELGVQPGTQALRLKTLSRCLPLFVSILGDDYGDQVKSPDAELSEHYPWLEGREGVSLIDMELSTAMRHAEVAPSPGTIAYLIKSEPRGINEEKPRGARKMSALRERVTDSRMRVLQATSMQAAVKQMSTEIIGAIQSEFPRLSDIRRIMPIQIVRDSHEGFASAAGATAVAVPKSGVVSQLSAYVNSSDGMSGTPLVVASEYPSAGATTAITSWIAQSRHFTRPDEMVFRFVHFCGAGATPGVNTLVYRLVRELRAFLNEDMVLGSMDPVEFGREVPALFQTLHKAGMAAIIVIDGLASLAEGLQDPARQGGSDQGPAAAAAASAAVSPGAQRRENASHVLDWLPMSLPDDIKVILSVGADPELQFEVKRRHWPVLSLPCFTEEESAGLLMSLQRQPGGHLPDDDVRFLMMAAEARPQTRANPLFLQVAACLLRDPHRVQALASLGGTRGFRRTATTSKQASSGASSSSHTTTAGAGMTNATTTATATAASSSLSSSSSAAADGGIGGRGVLTTEEIVQADDVMHLYRMVLDVLESRPPPSHPRLLSDVLSLLQLSVHGLSKTELLHVLCIPKSLFEAFFGGYESVLFVQVSGENVRPEGSRRVTLASTSLRKAVRERYLATEGLTRSARMRLIEHFEGFIGPGTLEGLPTLEEIITCGKDGDFARSSHELAWALVREEAWDYVGQLIGNLAVFRTLWSSDVRRDVYLMWVTLQRHVDPVDAYWDAIIDLYWTTTDDAGNQDLVRTLPLARLAADIGEMLLLLGNPAAVKLINLAVELHKKLHGSDQHPDVARCHFMLGHLHRGAGPASTLDAISAYESSYNIYARTVGNSVPAVAALVSLGETLITQGALNEALEALRLAKKMLEDLGIAEFHPQSARCFNNMGLVAKRTGQLTAAEAYYKKALAIRVECHGEDHPHTAVTLRNLGSLAFTMQHRDKAVQHFSRALAISQRVHGPMHATTAATHEWLGGVLQEMGNETEGKVHAATAAFIREKVRSLAEQSRAVSAAKGDEREARLPRPGRGGASQQPLRPGDTIEGAVVDV